MRYNVTMKESAFSDAHTETLDLKDRGSWREWLKKNHATSAGIWVVINKKESSTPRLSLDDAVEEAICFGWIDSIIKKIDEEKYVRKFTPRTNRIKWSDLNLKKVRELMAKGLMTKAGLATIDDGLLKGTKRTKARPVAAELKIPPYLSQALEADPRAKEYFAKLAPSYKKLYIGWIDSAKKEETRQRRLQEAIDKLSRGEKLGLK